VVVSGTEPAARPPDIRDARRLFPATADRAYFNTAATGLASQRLADRYHAFNHEDDIERLVATLASSGRKGS
jgi:hypothetical protein